MTWPDMPLGEAVDLKMGRQRSPKHASGDNMVPYLRAANVQDGWVDLGDVKTMNFDLDEQDRFRLEQGDVLVTEGSGSIETVGASARWEGEIPGVVAFQNTLLRLRARAEVTTPAFVYHLARWLYWTGKWADVATGTNIFHIGSKRADSLSVPVPPLAEQQRIADLIDHIDRALTVSQSLVDRLSSAEDALREELLVGPTVQLGEVAEVGSGPSWKASDESAAPESDSTPVLKITNTRPDGTIDLSETAYVAGLPESTRTIDGRGLVLIRTNGNRDRIGNVYLPPPEAHGFAVSAFQMLATLDEGYDRELLFHALARPSVQRLMSDTASGTTGLGNLGVRWLRGLDVPAPELAPRVLPILREGLRAVGMARTQVLRLRAARQAVLQEALGGEKRIPESYDRFLDKGVA